MTDKIIFRKNAKTKRKELFSNLADKAEADMRIFENFIYSGLAENRDIILSYFSFGAEADTIMLIDELIFSGKNIALPRCCDGGHMDFYKINSRSELKLSSYNIPEPEANIENLIDKFDNALCIVPGMSFDRTGRRMGYGGGYYDRFLEKNSSVVSVGFCYDALICDSVPSEPHDRCVDYIITEKGIIVTNG